MSFILPAIAGGIISAASGKGFSEVMGWKRGGKIPGKAGKAKLVVAHAGELVLTPAQQKKIKQAKTVQGVRKTMNVVAKKKPKKIKLKRGKNPKS